MMEAIAGLLRAANRALRTDAARRSQAVCTLNLKNDGGIIALIPTLRKLTSALQGSPRVFFSTMERTYHCPGYNRERGKKSPLART